MGTALLLLLQAASAAPPERIDLTLPAATAACRRSVDDEIVVCGGRESPYRLQPLGSRYERTLIPTAETAFLGGIAVGAIEAEAVQMPGGLQSSRLMARIKLPF